jgi:phage terminase small subunit
MEPMNEGELTERQRKLVQYVATGDPVQQAARKAGFSASYARKSSRLLKHPAIAQAVAAIRTDARREAVYGLVEAVREIDKAIVFGYSVSNPMSS